VYRDIRDFLEINGLQSVTVMFSILFKYENGRWKMIETGDGFALYQQLQAARYFTLSKANSTQFIHFNEELMDAYYAARFDANSLSKPKDLKAVLTAVHQIRSNFVSPQIFINDFYELSENETGLEHYIQNFGSIH
jgi:hypothetical protein